MSSVCSECIRESWLPAYIRENADQHDFCEEAADEPMAIEPGEIIDYIRERIEGPLSTSSRMSLRVDRLELIPALSAFVADTVDRIRWLDAQFPRLDYIHRAVVVP